MSIVFSGGMWTVALITAVLCGYVWALDGPKIAYKLVFSGAILIMVLALFLPEAHVFRMRIVEGFHWWKWALAIAVPVGLYTVFLRWIKKKADARHDS